jgi:hypothetical protein
LSASGSIEIEALDFAREEAAPTLQAPHGCDALLTGSIASGLYFQSAKALEACISA